MTKTRDIALDGLRGVAALCVVLSHVAAMTWVPFAELRPPTWLEWALWNMGAPAVDVFFVLSGYVVAGSLLRRSTPYGGYMLSRMVRLYPVAWLAVLAGVALRLSGLSLPIGMTSAFRITAPITLSDVMGFMTMVAPIPNANIVNPPIWTLVVEMQAAFAMPLMAALARRSPVGLAIAGMLLPLAAAQAIGYTYPFQYTGFIIGAALAAGETRIPKAPVPAAVLVFCVTMLLARHVLRTEDVMMRAPCSLAAAGLILSIRQGALRGVLEHRHMQWLGSVSYPLYAVHWPIMAAMAILLGPRIGFTAAALLAVPIAIAVAWIVEGWIDRPAVSLSRMMRSG